MPRAEAAPLVPPPFPEKDYETFNLYIVFVGNLVSSNERMVRLNVTGIHPDKAYLTFIA